MLKQLWLATALCCASSVVIAAEPLPDAQAVSRYADQLMQQQPIDNNSPGVAVLVARADELLFKKAYGQANIELGVPLSPEHKFRIGSVTKQFAAAALLRLIDEGKASLTDPLSKYLPDYPEGHAITLLQLLNHTSGVKSYTGIPGYMHNKIRRELTTAELIDEFKDLPVDFAPGADFKYNNSGYVLLGAVIEAISGKSWHDYINDALLQPNKLNNIVYPAEQTVIAGMASGYSLRPGQDVQKASLLSMTQPHAAGALIADLNALWQWNRLLHGGKLLKAATYQQMITPVDAAAQSDRNYGFGISRGTLRGMPELQHGGGINGFVSMLVYLPQQDVTVAMLRNSDGPGPDLNYLSRKIAAFASGNPYPEFQPVTLTEAQLHEVSGVYSKGDDSRTLEVRDGKLFSTRAGSRPFELIAQGNNSFGFTDSVTRMVIQRDQDGNASGLSMFYDGDGEGEVWQRTDDITVKADISLTPEQQQPLIGDYASEQLQLKIFQNDDNGLMVQVTGQPALALKAASERSLYLTVVDAKLEFAPATGQATQVTLIQGPERFVLTRQ
ncbi:CubicO group peptidase, beta-lactamase class C family [Arsukibacterium tuosuense]|uniref:CubicO group peptidase, beta-lactamase class C family n=1 Tax=Arsukibacterium tuosuense TaxID=1323745 RepID=A0A285IXE2_9GAMM|nr:serine hydrolase domain-containing protein [Arsukibacterium tuosuense]SNY52664.1 CubicO group peptidase, beta-lactamase class C family [Arsukibacterium tuosuense]